MNTDSESKPVAAPRRSTRIPKPPKRYEDETWIPGSNNKYTIGRKIDSWDRDY